MKLLFAHSFFMDFDEKQRQVREPYPPLGTLIAAACAREAGHDVSLFDAMPATSPKAFETVLDQAPYEAVIFFEDNFNWLSKMCLERMRGACKEMIAAAVRCSLPVIVAGSDPSDCPEVYLAAGAGYVVKGEAEFRILEILEHLRGGSGSVYEGAGVCQSIDGQLVTQAPVRGERDLARFPWPAWDLVEMDTYRRIWRENHGYFSLNMMTTRGCPYRCNWCAKPIHGRRYDVRDPLDTAREMHFLKTRFAPDHIWFTDDIFGLKPKWVARFAAEVERLAAQIPFKIQARADLIDAEFVAGLVAAGCRTVWMGVESGSQQVLDAMDKDLQVSDIYRATKLLKQAGIESCFFLQFGYPGERIADLRQTWQMVAELRPDQIGISVAYPLPGTEFHARVKDQLGAVDHWEHSQHMRPLHRTPYPAAFYPILYRYFHRLFRQLKQPARGGLRGLKDRLFDWRLQRKLKGFGIEGVPFS